MVLLTNTLVFLRDIDDFELIDGVASAIKAINVSGYLAIVVTNQPVIARGEVSLKNCRKFIIRWKCYWENRDLMWMQFIIVHIIRTRDRKVKDRN